MKKTHSAFFRLIVLTAGVTFICMVFTSPVFSKTITIKMGNVDSPFKLTLTKSNGEFASTDIKCEAFKKIIEESSHGRIKVKVFPAGQLGGEREMLEMTKMGSLQMNGCSAATLPNFVPEVMAIQIPYIFKDPNVALKVMRGPLGRELDELIVKKMGMRILAWGFEGYYNIGNVKRPIVIPADLKGLKIRTGEAPNIMETVRLAGAVPTPISFSEIYTTLQQGVVDGVMTGIGLHYTIKTHELLKYYNVANLFFGWSPIAINEKFYQSLSPEDQYLIQEAALKAMTVYQGMYFWGRDLWVELFQKRGIEFSFPTPAQEQQWVEAIKNPMIEWTRKKIGTEWVDKVLKASTDTEKELYGH